MRCGLPSGRSMTKAKAIHDRSITSSRLTAQGMVRVDHPGRCHSLNIMETRAIAVRARSRFCGTCSPVPFFFSLDERTSMISSLNHETTQPQAIAVTDSPPHELAHSIDQVDQTNWDPAYH
ncbi:hypothetical protein NW765_009590 [Fusarium oxysporum]|nr:hypothetical protein NW765_009590 [Fusarium oxysporum]